jgi:hypothetical protein
MDGCLSFEFHKFEECDLKPGDKCPFPRCIKCKIIITNGVGVRFECGREPTSK